MAMVCVGCGAYVAPLPDKTKDVTCCPECGHIEPMRFLPLFIVTGASGSGKTAVVKELRRRLPDFEVFETDLIWGTDWQQTRNNWLRIAHSIAQSGRYTLLCGTLLPSDIDQCDHRPYFSHIHYLNLHCEDEVRDARLRARPAWRGCDEPFVESQRKLARWLLDHANTDFAPPLVTVDTTRITIEETAQRICKWALTHSKK